MGNVTLEKVDVIRERTGVSYEKAKEALESCDGDVLEALIYIEKIQGISNENNDTSNDANDETKNSMSIEDLKVLFTQIIEKGNVTRIKIKKDNTEIIDIPVNAGIAAGFVGIIIPQILAVGVIAAIATKITIEITKEDGSVEIINKYVSKVANDVKDKATDLAEKFKAKVNAMKNDKKDNSDLKQNTHSNSETIYSYTVDFDNEKEKSEN
jgi:hypothetical protein